jgi:two-component system NtrC family response regulator
LTTPPTILVAEDEALLRRILTGLFEDAGYRVVAASTGREALERFAEMAPDLVVTDIRMPEMDGLELLERLKAIDPDVLVIIMTAFSSVESAVAALRAGAHDYIVKPFVNDDVLQSVRNALRQKELFLENRSLRRELDRSRSYSAIIGVSDAVQTMLGLVGKVAATNASILITGESGTGKELVARAVHFQSQRAKGPFVAVNCGALNENLLEAELFGHEKGAFTGATHAREGLLKAADGGTIFLDEIADMPQSLQVKLLRALQEREVLPVGGRSVVPFDARVVTASNRDLEDEVAAGRFREDLFYRLSVIPVRVPPLRERSGDIPLLARHFAARFGADMGIAEIRFEPDALEALGRYGWPGNIRELMNAIERAVALGGAVVAREHLPERVLIATGTSSGTGSESGSSLEDVERRHVLATLERHGGNKAQAAESLGIDLSTLYRKLRRYETGT